MFSQAENVIRTRQHKQAPANLFPGALSYKPPAPDEDTVSVSHALPPNAPRYGACSSKKPADSSDTSRASSSSQHTQRSSNVWCSDSGSGPSFTAYTQEPLFDSMLHDALLALQPSPHEYPTPTPDQELLHPTPSPLFLTSGIMQVLGADFTDGAHHQSAATNGAPQHSLPSLPDRRTPDRHTSARFTPDRGPLASAAAASRGALSEQYQLKRSRWLQAKWEQSREQARPLPDREPGHMPSMPASSASMRHQRSATVTTQPRPQADSWGVDDLGVDEDVDVVEAARLPPLPEVQQQCRMYRRQGRSLSASPHKVVTCTYEVMEGLEDRGSRLARRDPAVCRSWA
ncbi:MAG: hypothetical protein WDW36_007446 [Sanguina aurantia]